MSKGSRTVVRRCGARAANLAHAVRPIPRCDLAAYHAGWHEHHDGGVHVRWHDGSYEIEVPTHGKRVAA